MWRGLFVPDDNQDNAKTRLADLPHGEDGWLIYEYDFFDGWEHELRVGKLLPVGGSANRKVSCTDGGRACPPEDWGGPPGHERLLTVIASPKHPEHGRTLEWSGDRFDPEAFDAKRVDTALLKLKTRAHYTHPLLDV